jgi:TorA maturation chaperone TorD
MRMLCEEEARCRNQGDAEAAADFAILQHRFLQEHLLLWVPGYCQNLLTQATCGFYRGLAQLLLYFLEQEASLDVERSFENHQMAKLHQRSAMG